MMRLWQTAILAVGGMALAGCAFAPSARPGGDGQDRYVPTWTLDEMTIRWHPVTADDLAEIAAMISPYLEVEVHGVAIPQPSRGLCDVYAPEPSSARGHGMMVLGHEVAHCFRGSFHSAGEPAGASNPDSLELLAMQLRARMAAAGLPQSLYPAIDDN